MEALEIKGKVNTAICYAKVVEDEAIEQIRRMCDYVMTEGSKIRIMPDVHAGKGCTIGTTMTITDKAVPNVVGVDIGCGMYTVNLGKIDIDFEVLDYATISAHKIYGPKGIGALCMKNGSKLKPLLLGGGQEGGLRSGTENIASIMAFYEACKQIDIKRDYAHVSKLRQKYVDELLHGERVALGFTEKHLPHIENLRITAQLIEEEIAELDEQWDPVNATGLD